MNNFKTLFLLIIAIILYSCGGEEIDSEKPVIDLTFKEAFPLNCDTLYFGESFAFKMLFTDNQELGSYSIDIHNNFDHHSHTTEVTECTLDPKKDPVNPIAFIEDYSIPEGLTEYETELSIALRSGDENGDYDDGDYHFFLRLTDAEGWSTQKGLSIKIFHRN